MEKIYKPDLIIFDEFTACEWIQSFSFDDVLKTIEEFNFETGNEILSMEIEDALRTFLQIWRELLKEIREKFQNKRKLFIQGISDVCEVEYLKQAAKIVYDRLKDIFMQLEVDELVQFDVLLKIFRISPGLYKIFQGFGMLLRNPEKVVIEDRCLFFLPVRKVKTSRIIILDGIFGIKPEKILEWSGNVKHKKSKIIVFLEEQSKNVILVHTTRAPSRIFPFSLEGRRVINLISQQHNNAEIAVICKSRFKKAFQKLGWEAISHFSSLSINSLRSKNLVLWGVAVPSPEALKGISTLLNDRNWKEEAVRFIGYYFWQEIGRARNFLEGKDKKVYIVFSHFPFFTSFLGLVYPREVVIAADNEVALAIQMNKMNKSLRKTKQIIHYWKNRITLLSKKIKDFISRAQEFFKKIKEIVVEVVILMQNSFNFERTDKKSDNNDFSYSFQLRAPPQIQGGEVC